MHSWTKRSQNQSANHRSRKLYQLLWLLIAKLRQRWSWSRRCKLWTSSRKKQPISSVRKQNSKRDFLPKTQRTNTSKKRRTSRQRNLTRNCPLSNQSPSTRRKVSRAKSATKRLRKTRERKWISTRLGSISNAHSLVKGKCYSHRQVISRKCQIKSELVEIEFID